MGDSLQPSLFVGIGPPVGGGGGGDPVIGAGFSPQFVSRFINHLLESQRTSLLH